MALSATAIASASSAALGPAPSASPVASAAAPLPVSPDEARFNAEVLPLFARHACGAGPCHAMGKGGGFYLPGGDRRAYSETLAQIDRDHPAESRLFVKATGREPHNGGKNLAEDECDARALLAFIGRAPAPACASAVAKVDELPRFTREAAPALRSLGCATAACHAGSKPARAALDLLSLDGPAPSDVAPALASVTRTLRNRVVPWMSPVLQAAWGEGSKAHEKVDVTSCAHRRLQGFIAGAPEITCDVAAPARRAPSLEALVSTVMPALARRGCIDATCHASGAGGLPLFDPANNPHAAVSDWVGLLARVEEGKPIEETTLFKKARNVIPHGGGKRLGGAGDCTDAMLVSWLAGRPVSPCGPKPAPTFERFASDVQPVLDKLTCTQSRCHGRGVRNKLEITPRAEGADLEANYRRVLSELDLEFAPFSEVMLRMREPCAYTVVAAWIEGSPRPSCTVGDPKPGMFPRLDD